MLAGRAFLPEFNEGTLTLSAVTLPGTSLEESNRLGLMVEQSLLKHPEVVATARRTGRAELDEHAQDVNSAEIDMLVVPALYLRFGSVRRLLVTSRAAARTDPASVAR